MTARRLVVSLVDVANTIHNDDIAAGLQRHLEREIGRKRRERYWVVLAALRAGLGSADYVGALPRYRMEHPREPDALTVSSVVVNDWFGSRLYRTSLDVLRRFRVWGPTVILSDGDAVLQPEKIERLRLEDAVDGIVLVSIHKEREVDDVEMDIENLVAYWRVAATPSACRTTYTRAVSFRPASTS